MRVCVGQVLGPHGVRGLVKLASFTVDPQSMAAYGPLTDAEGARRFDIELLSSQKGCWLARFNGIEDRDAAQALSGLRLYIDRERLPAAEEDEFYHADLVGLTVEEAGGKVLGKVAAVYNFGAGDVLEVEGASGERPLLPFTRSVVPLVDLEGRRIVVNVPAGLEEKGP